jgi:hypothetical protein
MCDTMLGIFQSTSKVSCDLISTYQQSPATSNYNNEEFHILTSQMGFQINNKTVGTQGMNREKSYSKN